MPLLEGTHDARGLRVALIASRYNDFVTERLLEGAAAMCRESGALDHDLVVLRVPGAFELPQAAGRAAASGQYDAIVCLGCLIRGATPHFEYIAAAVAHGLTAVATASGVPVAFGVLTTNSVEEALERAGPGPENKGREAAGAALEMATLYRQLSPPAPGRRA